MGVAVALCIIMYQTQLTLSIRFTPSTTVIYGILIELHHSEP